MRDVDEGILEEGPVAGIRIDDQCRIRQTLCQHKALLRVGIMVSLSPLVTSTGCEILPSLPATSPVQFAQAIIAPSCAGATSAPAGKSGSPVPRCKAIQEGLRSGLADRRRWKEEAPEFFRHRHLAIGVIATSSGRSMPGTLALRRTARQDHPRHQFRPGDRRCPARKPPSR